MKCPIKEMILEAGGVRKASKIVSCCLSLWMIMTLSYIIFESCWGYEGHSKIIDHCLARFYISLMELRCRLLPVGPPRLPVRHTLLTLLQPNCLSVFQYWFLHFSILRISQIRRLGRGDQVGRLRDRGEAEGSKLPIPVIISRLSFVLAWRSVV